MYLCFILYYGIKHLINRPTALQDVVPHTFKQYGHLANVVKKKAPYAVWKEANIRHALPSVVGIPCYAGCPFKYN